VNHVFIPGIAVAKRALPPFHERYLREWRAAALSGADSGDISSGICFQGALIELLMAGRVEHDWVGVMDEYLSRDGTAPLAYSRLFAKRLYGFEDQYRQSSVAAIYTRWWIECSSKGSSEVDHTRFASLISEKIDDASGLILDTDISPTILRHRMKTEITMSAAMGIEILATAGPIPQSLSADLVAAVIDPRKCPPTPYISAEYFRAAALASLGSPHLLPGDIAKTIADCQTDLKVGYCDFPMSSKYDAYMGTAKRTSRDKPIHSPLTAIQVRALLPHIQDGEKRNTVQTRLRDYRAHLQANPNDIPAFQMRDVQVPFGSGLTPIEAICAVELTG
jgi:hypothetical protein